MGAACTRTCWNSSRMLALKLGLQLVLDELRCGGTGVGCDGVQIVAQGITDLRAQILDEGAQGRDDTRYLVAHALHVLDDEDVGRDANCA